MTNSPIEIDPDELLNKAIQMEQDLQNWLDNYEPYFGHRYIVKTIKALHADLVKQLDYEQYL